MNRKRPTTSAAKRTARATQPTSKKGKRLSVLEKDQKILWSRAAGRCAIATCRVKVTLNEKAGGQGTVGDMAHIIGYEKKSARSISPLTPRERNAYDNLVLLCRHHHGIVDTDVAAYPVEVLHAIKAAHEAWVEDSLSGSQVDPGQLVHADMVDTITTELQLNQWPWFIDNAVRDLVHRDLIDAAGVLNAKIMAAVWPADRPALTAACTAVVEAYSDFASHFVTSAELRHETWFAADKSYKRFYNPDYDKKAEAEDRWSRRNFALLCRYVLRLNEFADAVRAELNPLYFRLAGRFLVLDTMGYRYEDASVVLPDEAMVQQLMSDNPKRS